MHELTRAAGCGWRSLQTGFQAAFQVTPQQYTMRARLDLAHSRLQLASQGESVANTAHDCGFTHLWRFSQAYQQVFDQPPSATLKNDTAKGFDASGLRKNQTMPDCG